MTVAASQGVRQSMKISEISCSSCGALYEMAEACSMPGKPGHAGCAVCGGLLVRWQEPKYRVFRLVMPPEHRYAKVPTPPAASAYGSEAIRSAHDRSAELHHGRD